MATIGLLLPHSTLYPTLSFDLLEGIKAGLADALITNLTWVVESIGFGTDVEELRGKAQKLLMQDSADLVVGMMSRRMAEQVAPTFTAANRLLLVLDVLGDFFSSVSAAPTVFYHSLQSCLYSRLTARKAVESGATRVIQAMSFYDAGYLQGYAVAQGVETSGGQIVQYAVSSHIPAQVNLQNLQDGLTSAQAVVAQYAGDMAGQFYQLYATLSNQLPLWAGPMLLEEQMLATVPFGLENVRGYVAWSGQLETANNDTFKASMRRRGREPNLFSMLAYEAGFIVADYLRSVEPTGYPTPADFDRLKTLSFNGPRGQVTFDPNTHYSWAMPYAATVIAHEQGCCRLADLLPEPTVLQDYLAFKSEPNPLSHTGWHNTFLCI
ncbi:ABC transporter substrate-binding protein [Spirosoma spitsbergense]|uniref:ABC transporter substrate-binding protein n=1 Tax=Spirosoma spitsbergense TaxID=431554 RepID=UPI00037E2CD1|nr:ABC transporter substrate-binding protein [Spirosoma spitsbergense]